MPVEVERKPSCESCSAGMLKECPASCEWPVDRCGDHSCDRSSGRAWLPADESPTEVHRPKEPAKDETSLIKRVVQIEKDKTSRADSSSDVPEPDLRFCGVVQHSERVCPIDRAFCERQSSQIRLDAGNSVGRCVRPGYLDASPQIDGDNTRTLPGNFISPTAGAGPRVEHGLLRAKTLRRDQVEVEREHMRLIGRPDIAEPAPLIVEARDYQVGGGASLPPLRNTLRFITRREPLSPRLHKLRPTETCEHPRTAVYDRIDLAAVSPVVGQHTL